MRVAAAKLVRQTHQAVGGGYRGLDSGGRARRCNCPPTSELGCSPRDVAILITRRRATREQHKYEERKNAGESHELLRDGKKMNLLFVGPKAEKPQPASHMSILQLSSGNPDKVRKFGGFFMVRRCQTSVLNERSHWHKTIVTTVPRIKANRVKQCSL